MNLIIWALMAILSNQSFAESKVSHVLKDHDASQLYRILSVESGENGKQLKALNGKFSLTCQEKENICEIEMSVSAMKRDKTIYLYRSAEAEVIYNAIAVKEIDGTLGKLKIWTDSAAYFEIFCSQSPVPTEKNPFSCMISLR